MSNNKSDGGRVGTRPSDFTAGNVSQTTGWTSTSAIRLTVVNSQTASTENIAGYLSKSHLTGTTSDISYVTHGATNVASNATNTDI